MNIVGWIVWGIACGWTVFSCVAFVSEVFWPQASAQPRDARVFFSPQIKRLISGVYVVGMVAALFVTGIWGISKLHLLWFTPFWHFFGTQWIAWVYEKRTLRSKQYVSAQTLGRVMPPDALQAMLEKYRIAAKIWREKGYSQKETFWILFAVMAMQPFIEVDETNKRDLQKGIRLSEILSTQLAIYREEVDQGMKHEDVGAFLILLKKKFDEIQDVFYSQDNPEGKLCAILYELGEKHNGSSLVHATAAALYVIEMGYGMAFLHDKSKRLRLVRDI
jgi:hypothetical protein